MNYDLDASETLESDFIGSFRRRSQLPDSLSDGSGGSSAPSAKAIEDLLTVRGKPRMNTVYDVTEDDVELSIRDDKEEDTGRRHGRNWRQFTVIAFLNSGSGGGLGKTLLKSMRDLLGEDMVFDLSKCAKGNMPEDKLMGYATDPFVRVLACGGDGTMGWILSSIDKVWERVLGKGVQLENTEYRGYLPLAMMPLGTGNDLSRQFKWGGTYSPSMAQREMIDKVVKAAPVPLDRWRCVVVPFNSLDDDTRSWVPAMLGEKMRDRQASIHELTKIFAPGEAGGEQAKASTQSFDGVFCNYFSIGIDARVAFSFHKEREEHPERFNSVLGNKLKYIKKGLTVGGLLSVSESSLPPRLNDKVKILVSGEADGSLEELEMPPNCRGVALLNIQSYGGGNRFTNGGSCEDGAIEVVFFRHAIGMATCAAWSPVMPCIRFKVRARTDRVCIRMNESLHCQVDGEPWLQSEGIFQISYFGRSPVLKNARPGCCC